jgi:hypothetical protein
MSFPKEGKFFPGNPLSAGAEIPSDAWFAAEIAAALHRTLGATHASIKTAAGWAGASERTAKNWFSGRYGPSGAHLVGLIRNSDEVLNTILAMADRPDLIAATRLAHAEKAILDALSAIQNLKGFRRKE